MKFYYLFLIPHSLAPGYIFDLLCAHSTYKDLGFSNQLLFTIAQARMSFKGDQAFSAAALRLWNSLPFFIRPSPTADNFKSNLFIFLAT